ncbi:MAG: hypothetical protein K0V04_09475, partial [Deltaproteobacteria bacterium]|nr:hypothetical protein [Deltaproteobacteria bacterium]
MKRTSEPPTQLHTNDMRPHRAHAVRRIIAALALSCAACSAPDHDRFVLDDDREEPDPIPDAKAKVYIMLGQSNMVGFGQVSAESGGARIKNIYVSPDEGAELGMELSVYSGAHEPGVDYDTLDPIYSATVRLNDDNDDRWPTIDGPHTGIGRGYFEAQETGEYVFSWGYGASSYASVILGGEEVYRRDVGDSVSKREPFTVTEGQRYEFQVTYFTSASPGAWTS